MSTFSISGLVQDIRNLRVYVIQVTTHLDDLVLTLTKAQILTLRELPAPAIVCFWFNWVANNSNERENLHLAPDLLATVGWQWGPISSRWQYWSRIKS